MKEVDEETRDQFRRVIDAVIETRTAVDQKLDAFREEVRGTQDRLLTAMDSVATELRDLRQEYHSINAVVYRLEARFDHLSQETRDDVTDIRRRLSVIDTRLSNLETRRDHDA